MPTSEEVDNAIHAIGQAKAHAQKLCEAFAESYTGLKVGDRICHPINGAEVVVKRFTGFHPASWAVQPYIEAYIVNQDGKAGKRTTWIRVYPGREFRWKKAEASGG